MQVTIDPTAGFCWGVVKTIDTVEKIIEGAKGKDVYVLGDIIHNPAEIKRLQSKSLKTIEHSSLANLRNTNSIVVIRAHGEPPSTYTALEELGIEYIDATCPLVKALQERVQKYYREGYQIIIFGKKEHAEVVGIRGVCNDECVVIRNAKEAVKAVDLSRKILLISQTTMDKNLFYGIKDAILEYLKERMGGEDIAKAFVFKDTICHYVADRGDELIEFARANDVIVFVAGKNSSNAKSLFNLCRTANPNSYFVENFEELDLSSLHNVEKIGITGATSTPLWLLNEVKEKVEKYFSDFVDKSRPYLSPE